MLRSNSPGASTFLLLPVTKSIILTSRGLPLRGKSVTTPSSAVVSEVIGPAGSDMQMLPPTVAAFQILNDAKKARQQSWISGAAIQSFGGLKSYSSRILQVAAM